VIEKTSLLVPFDVGKGPSGAIRIELDPHIPYEGWQIILRVYASGDYPIYRATIGSVGRIESGIKEMKGEVVIFTNSDEASLSLPPSSYGGVRIYTTGHTYNSVGQQVAVAITWDSEAQKLKADKKFYGAVTVDYQAPYSIVGYRYGEESIVVGRHLSKPIYSTKHTPGWVYAFVVRDGEKPRFGSYQIPDIEFTYDFGGAVDRLELYRLVSFALLTEDGMYEKHKDDDGEGFLPAGQDGYIVENKRTHLVGYLDKYGRAHELTYDVPLGIPFESERASANNQGYPDTSWEFTEFTDPSQTYDDSSLLTDAISAVQNKKKAVGEA
jgi:hypothetical protein